MPGATGIGIIKIAIAQWLGNIFVIQNTIKIKIAKNINTHTKKDGCEIMKDKLKLIFFKRVIIGKLQLHLLKIIFTMIQVSFSLYYFKFFKFLLVLYNK